MIEELLRNNKIKVTSQRITILNIINNLDTNATIKNVVIKATKKMNQSTAYRVIEYFASKNILEKRINYNDEIYFAIKEEHGHYFICQICHKKEKLENCPILNITESLSEDGYEVLNHVVLISGICKKCNIKKG